MTPQLFINYKMKSVAHLPWRMLTYKALNTFIDDLFAFVIKMPMMYRIGCLRDGTCQHTSPCRCLFQFLHILSESESEIPHNVFVIASRWWNLQKTSVAAITGTSTFISLFWYQLSDLTTCGSHSNWLRAVTHLSCLPKISEVCTVWCDDKWLFLEKAAHQGQSCWLVYVHVNAHIYSHWSFLDL